MRIKYTTEEINNIVNKFEQCKSYKEVADYFGFPISSCKSLLNRRGYFNGGRSLKLDQTKAEELIIKCKEYLNKNSYSFNDLCKEIKINPYTFKNYLIQNGIKGILELCCSSNKKKTALNEDTKNNIIKLEKEGKGNDVIGKILGVNGTTVRYYLIEYYGKEKYEERHSVDKFYTPWYSGFVNERGDRFHSTLEMLVADYLYENNVKYKTQEYIKFPNGKFIYPDFYLEDYKLYIEVFGMSTVPFYIEGMKLKIKLCEDNNIPLLGLYYENFKENNWKNILINKLNL